METKTCKSGFRKTIVQHFDGSKSIVCKRVSGKAKLTPEQKAAYAKRKGKKLSATTKARIAKALKLRKKK
jgi:hypothetical protein